MKTTVLSFIGFILCFPAVEKLSKTASQSIAISGTVKSSGVTPRYAYFAKGDQNSFRKCEIVNDTFTFLVNDVPIDNQRHAIYALISISDDNYQNYEEYISAFRSGRIPYKSRFNFILDSARIYIQIDLDDSTSKVKGGILNEQQTLADAIRDEALSDRSGRPLLERNTRRITEDLALINKYPFSPVSLGMLEPLLLNGQTYKDPSFASEAKKAVERLRLSPSLDRQKIDRLADLYDEKVSRSLPKGDFPFPIASLDLPDGNVLDLNGMSGGRRYMIVDFWATWCTPCLEQRPLFEKIINNQKDRSDIMFISVSIDKNRAAWERFTENNPQSYPSYWLDQQKHPHFIDALGISSIPNYVIVDVEKRKVVRSNLAIGQLEDAVKEL